MASVQQRIARGAAVLALALGVLFGAPATAQASEMDCMLYLVEEGYIAGPRMHAACTESTKWDGFPRCVAQLIAIGVERYDAEPACFRA